MRTRWQKDSAVNTSRFRRSPQQSTRQRCTTVLYVPETAITAAMPPPKRASTIPLPTMPIFSSKQSNLSLRKSPAANATVTVFSAAARGASFLSRRSSPDSVFYSDTFIPIPLRRFRHPFFRFNPYHCPSCNGTFMLPRRACVAGSMTLAFCIYKETHYEEPPIPPRISPYRRKP